MLRKITNYRIQSPPRRWPRQNPVSFYDDESLPEGVLSLKRGQYERWKELFVETAQRFESTAVEETHPLKIAVLDTGLDQSHQDIMTELGRIWIYESSRDLFERAENSTIKDLQGHGTHIVGLILEYAPEADLYVADVTIDGEADRNLIAKVRYNPVEERDYAYNAQAIVSAVNHEVDIISISFGFQRKSVGDDLEQAIDYAKSKGVHIVAAASNSGGNAGRAWPARYDGVFCIHSTDANGNPSGFNPTALEEVNFATVGEAIVSSWPGHLSESPGNDGTDDSDTLTKVKSGTSFATPIAASIIAFVLRYARTHLDQEYAQQLRRHAVMGSVLRCMAGPKRLEFYYLALHSNPAQFFGRENPEDTRGDIITAISQSG
ncbi:hypothetical protein J4E86_011737 [Alternaria arbusti]|uniref:uncharacterized protein n=1 Tax=Alternaria arbusti TaxID=232088 RepID=UPI00221FB35C|nr:uncharacterized protein J4E86_011737 [Alternaria arbusti]KAI4929209.1 hypothetical protein J4E86_011737 [Alternaria arbusti]